MGGILLPNLIIIYHGTRQLDFAPNFGGGRNYHDFGKGLYATEDIEAAKEWACQDKTEYAYIYTYELDTAVLNIINLEKSNIIQWVSALMQHRPSKKIRGAGHALCEKMIKIYGIDVETYDAIRGYRADNSNFQFASDFVSGVMSLPTLRKVVNEGALGLQICIKSALAYESLELVQVEKISGEKCELYHERYLAKDSAARTLANSYLNEPQIGQLLSDVCEGVAK
ncbi:MAG: DUF3990 domain-containing protein [Clostridiales bacterium]|jgi:hypothetical protein|nr:DUF3990 domain-containing protein [Clostridiales bacterium]